MKTASILSYLNETSVVSGACSLACTSALHTPQNFSGTTLNLVTIRPYPGSMELRNTCYSMNFITVSAATYALTCISRASTAQALWEKLFDAVHILVSVLLLTLLCHWQRSFPSFHYSVINCGLSQSPKSIKLCTCT